MTIFPCFFSHSPSKSVKHVVSVYAGDENAALFFLNRFDKFIKIPP